MFKFHAVATDGTSNSAHQAPPPSTYAHHQRKPPLGKILSHHSRSSSSNRPHDLQRYGCGGDGALVCAQGQKGRPLATAARSPCPTHHLRGNACFPHAFPADGQEFSATTADSAVLTGGASADAAIVVLTVPSAAPRDQRGGRQLPQLDLRAPRATLRGKACFPHAFQQMSKNSLPPQPIQLFSPAARALTLWLRS